MLHICRFIFLNSNFKKYEKFLSLRSLNALKIDSIKTPYDYFKSLNNKGRSNTRNFGFKSHSEMKILFAKYGFVI